VVDVLREVGSSAVASGGLFAAAATRAHGDVPRSGLLGVPAAHSPLRLLHRLAHWNITWLTCFDPKTLLGMAELTEPSAIVLHPEIAGTGLPGLVTMLRQLCACPVVLIRVDGQLDAQACGADGEVRLDEPRPETVPVRPQSGELPGLVSEDLQLCWLALRLDGATRSAYWKDRLLPVSELQFRLLCVLGQARGGVVSFADLSDAVYGDSSGAHRGADRARIQAHVRRIRRLVEPDPLHPTVLLTVWGRGFRLADA